MHGMGSNILEGSMLIDFLPDDLALCCFDFSGSGKSQGSCSTFGIKEYRDIQSVINLLKKEGYTKFILWGRSMGAFASLAHTSTNSFHNSCILQVLDSPFSHFESVCRQRARNFLGFPEFFVNYSVNLLKKNMASHPFNPFEVDLREKAPFCRVPTIFVYNERDEVIPSENTQQLIEGISSRCVYERLIILDEHNSNRSPSSFKRVFQKIHKFMTYSSRKRPESSRKALNVCSSEIKKYGSSKYLSQTTESIGMRQRGALFCSMSREKKSPRENSKKLKLIRTPDTSFT